MTKASLISLARPLLALICLCTLCTGESALAGGGRRNVVVVANTASVESVHIAHYYSVRRNLPEGHLINITCPPVENTDWDTFETEIRQPVREAVQALESRGRRIDYIVLTEGIPLAMWSGPDGYSVDSVLTCMDEPQVDGMLLNPYGPSADEPGGWGTPAPEVTFSHDLDLSGHHLYLVSRLDGCTLADTERIIDDTARAEPGGTFFFDRRPDLTFLWRLMDDRLGQAADLLRARGIAVEEDHSYEFLGGKTDLAGYFGWGSNDPDFDESAYVSHQFRPGSIADSYVSTSARTLTCGSTGGQSLIADLFPRGLSAACGNVAEPYAALITYPNVVCDRYTRGFNVVESFYAANTRLHWRAIVAGDPLLAPWATPPALDLIVFDNAELSGAVSLGAVASDASGVAKLEFYLNDELVGVDQEAPYIVALDTTRFPDGPYVLEAVAYENSPVAAQSAEAASVIIQNFSYPELDVSQALGLDDGSIVVVNDALVTYASPSGRSAFLTEPGSHLGIEVYPAIGLDRGNVFRLFGQLTTRCGRRALRLFEAEHVGTAEPPRPVAIRPASLGGSSPYPELIAGFGSGGSYNVGMMVQVGGIVEELDVRGGRLRLAAHYPQPAVEILVERNVLTPGSQPPAPGSYAVVQGICSTEEVEGSLRLVIVARDWSMLTSRRPVTFESVYYRGLNLLCLPLDPALPEPAFVFRPAQGYPWDYRLEGNLWWWSLEHHTWLVHEANPPVQLPQPHGGAMCFILTSFAGPHHLVGQEFTEGADAWLPMPHIGGGPVGITGLRSALWNRCTVTDGFREIPIRQAVDEGWIEDLVSYYDAESGNTLPFTVTESATIDPGEVYLLQTRRANLAIIAYPSDD